MKIVVLRMESQPSEQDVERLQGWFSTNANEDVRVVVASPDFPPIVGIDVIDSESKTEEEWHSLARDVRDIAVGMVTGNDTLPWAMLAQSWQQRWIDFVKRVSGRFRR